MIQKIPKLKNFGIFRNFSWGNDVPEFKKYNLIYGWNKSGKTTISRFFSACEKRSTLFTQYPKGGEFEIRTENNSISHSNCQDCTLQIKVFNRDFVDENVSFDPLNASNPIVYVSEEDIESSKKLKESRDKIEALSQRLKFAQENRQRDEKVEDDFRRTTARTIKDIVGNLKVYDKYRNYDKSSLKEAIETVGVDNFSKLSDDDFEKYKKLIGSEAKQKQDQFSNYTVKFSFNGKQISTFSEIHEEAIQLLDKKIVAETIERLRNDPDLNAWVQTGYDLHKSRKEEKKCLFCQSDISIDFLTGLSRHFSNDYEKLQRDITDFIKEMESLKKENISEKNTDLYTDLQDNYKKHIRGLNDMLNKVNSWVIETSQKLRIKLNNPLSEVNSPGKPADFSTSYDKIVESVNEIISNHNERIDNHDKEIMAAKGALEKHLIADAIE